jgi:hypothetical protein
MRSERLVRSLHAAPTCVGRKNSVHAYRNGHSRKHYAAPPNVVHSENLLRQYHPVASPGLEGSGARSVLERLAELRASSHAAMRKSTSRFWELNNEEHLPMPRPPYSGESVHILITFVRVWASRGCFAEYSVGMRNWKEERDISRLWGCAAQKNSLAAKLQDVTKRSVGTFTFIVDNEIQLARRLQEKECLLRVLLTSVSQRQSL